MTIWEWQKEVCFVINKILQKTVQEVYTGQKFVCFAMKCVTGQKFVCFAMCFPTSSCFLDRDMTSRRASRACWPTSPSRWRNSTKIEKIKNFGELLPEEFWLLPSPPPFWMFWTLKNTCSKWELSFSIKREHRRFNTMTWAQFN